MIDDYIKKLIKQYQCSQGTESVDTNSDAFWKEFADWVLNNQKVGNIYIDFLVRLGLLVMDKNYLEIGKGRYDTLISEEFDSSILTTYSASFINSPSYSKVLKGNLFTNGNRLITIVEDPKKRSHEYHKLYFIDTVLTQNVYSNDELDKMSAISNYGIKIVLGAYGLISDKDRIEKIKQLRNIKSELINLYDEKYVYSGDKYVYCLCSKEKYNNFKQNKRTFTR